MLKIINFGKDSLSHKHKEEIKGIFHKSMNSLIKLKIIKIKSVAYSSQGSQTGQLDSSN